MRRLLLIVLLLAGCAPTGVDVPTLPALPSASGPAPGDANLSLTVEGARRDYTLHTPTSFAKGQTYPVILVFHGLSQTRADMVSLTKLNALADKENVLVAYLAYTGGRWDIARDKAYTLAVLDELTAKWGADRQRTFATGFSMGATFVNDLAVELPDRLRAIAAVGGGSRDIKTVRSGRPVPLLAIQGDRDRAWQSLLASNAEWHTWAGCGAQTTTEPVPGKVSQASSTCAGGSRHTIMVLTGVSHEWPNGEPIGYAIDAATVMWEFFNLA
jgi:poly(3-hydroxybutyrate) depolymerase